MNEEWVVRPLSEYTVSRLLLPREPSLILPLLEQESSMSIYKLSFVTLYREFVDHLATNRPPDYSFIIE